ncbi:MAG: Hsp20/alpha crystallin family protein [Deltaproteobacteria bacterium]|nr:Hsp20/alpha crystallin family protein [Deltaproteobacteria bacterium]MBN2674490.1 Hsp20/alpha crystallin family protein [Deltaproteobacteria bacterium]
MLTRWNDFGFGDLDRTFLALGELRNEMEKAFSDFDRGFGLRRLHGSAHIGPRTEFSDDGESLVVKAEVPGMSEKDLDITLEGTALSIRGKREDALMEGYTVHRKERGTYEFSRSFTLPCKVDGDKVKAALKDGVLVLTLPKLPDAKPKQISVTSN